MSLEIESLLTDHSSWLAAGAVGLAVGLVTERLLGGLLRKTRWKVSRPARASGELNKRTASWIPVQVNVSQATVPSDAADQLKVVMAAEFSMRPLLNKGEARLFLELDRMVLERNPGWQVMAQVSLGEILRTQSKAAFACINSKRVDLLLVDECCRPRHAIEYQGSGHHQSSAAARDAVKKEALRRAGIGYHEVVAGHTTPSDMYRLVAKIVDRPSVLDPAIQ